MQAADLGWMITATALVLFMTPGLAFFYGGMVGRKHVIATMLPSYAAMGMISVVWVLCGFSLSFGESLGGWIGNPLTYFLFDGVSAESPHTPIAATIPFALFALFQLKFAIITPALISGAVAERVRFLPFIGFMAFFSIFIYGPLAHMTWHPQGLLRVWGILDFAGGTVVHIAAGVAGLVCAALIGPRKNFKTEDPPSHHTPYVLLGTGMLWFGWFGFNAGSALGANAQAVLALLTTHVAAAAAMLSWLLLDAFRGKKSQAAGLCTGSVIGLVAITPGAGYVSVGSALLIGIIAAIVSYTALMYKARFRIDDTLDVFACHGLGGIVGMVLTGVFARDGGLITGNTALFTKHCLATLAITLGVALSTAILYGCFNYFWPLRANDTEEDLGLDYTQHQDALSLSNLINH